MRLLTTEDVAEQLHVTPAAVARWAAGGQLRGSKVGTRWLFSQDDVDEFVRIGENRPAGLQPPQRRRRRRRNTRPRD